MIITVKENDTLFSLSQQYGIPVYKIASDNGFGENQNLVVGQNLIIRKAKDAFVAYENTTVFEISNQFDINQKQIFKNNYFLKGLQNVPKDSFVVIEYENIPKTEKIIGGYAYDFMDENELSRTINYLTYVMPFTYGFDENGNLINADDEKILQLAKKSNVKPIMHVSTLTQDGVFDSNLPSYIFSDENARANLIQNIIDVVNKKGYYGVDVDFEFLKADDKENYVEFTRILADKLHEQNKILIIALPPKTSAEQTGALVDGIDYKLLGKNADYLLLMTYEWGYRFGPPLAIAPINQVRRVVEYAINEIDNKKLLLGIPNYGYDWTLPYEKGFSDAPSISPVEAVNIARKKGVEIQFYELSQAPFFNYKDELSRTHTVWFEDPKSYKAKTDLIKEYDMAGGFVWELLRDNPAGFVTLDSQLEIE